MRWTNTTRTNIRSLVDKYHLYDRTLNNNRVLLNGFGSPCTLFKNSTVTPLGNVAPNLTKCYCWNSQSNTPDRSHILCDGTGYLEGYQKYGYKEYTLSTPSTYAYTSPNIIVQADRKAFVMSGAQLSGYIETNWLSLEGFKEVDYFLVADQFDSSENRITYQYSLDGTTWVPLVMIPAQDLLSNRKASNFVLGNLIPTPTQIKFRIIFEKRLSISSSPKFNSIRFRYRNHPTLREIDSRFDISIPAFLASRAAPQEEVTQGEYGWTVLKPIKWWVLPEVNVEETDVIEFLTGVFSKQRYRAAKVVKYTYGPSLQILHREFESVLIRASDDVGGVLYTLL